MVAMTVFMPARFLVLLRRSRGLGAVSVGVALCCLVQRAEAFEHRHSVGVGYQAAHVSSKASGGFSVGQIPLSYHGRYGGRWAGWLRAAWTLPTRASDSVRSISPSAEYDRVQSMDAAAGVSLESTKIWGWTLDANFGPHFFFTRYRSDYYVEWANSMLGVALGATARRPIFSEFVAGVPELGVHLEGQWDFVDLMHGGDVTAGLGFSGQVSVGWAFGGPR